MSAYKTIVFAALLAALAGIVVAVYLTLGVHTGRLDPDVLRSFLRPLQVLVAVPFFAALVLQHEYAKAFGFLPRDYYDAPMSSEEHEGSLRWCPTGVRFIVFPAAIFAGAVSMLGGDLKWPGASPLTLPAARAVLLFHLTFLLITVPIVVSGLLVPRSFAAHVGETRRSR